MYSHRNEKRLSLKNDVDGVTAPTPIYEEEFTHEFGTPFASAAIIHVSMLLCSILRRCQVYTRCVHPIGERTILRRRSNRSV